MIDMKGKVAVVFGLANKRSIAYAIAEKLSEAGATLVLCYQSERLQREAEELIEPLGQNGTARAIPVRRFRRRGDRRGLRADCRSVSGNPHRRPLGGLRAAGRDQERLPR